MTLQIPLFPPLEAYNQGFLSVDTLHKLYWEESGNPQGEPILFLHGGPGSKTDPKHRQYFDPKRYRIILFDQRGCGLSTPFASIENNTTWDLVEDIEKLRKHLGIDQFALFGGSWGSTLALTYAIKHPSRVTKMILRGIFLGTQGELHWFYQNGANHFYPKEWKEYANFIPEAERDDLLSAYYKRLISNDTTLVKKAAASWSAWELSCTRMGFDPAEIQLIIDSYPVTAIACIEAHYFVNHCFFDEDEWILNHLTPIQNLPIQIIQGRFDILCPPITALRLSEKLPRASLMIVQEGGHASSDPKMLEAILLACNNQ